MFSDLSCIVLPDSDKVTLLPEILVEVGSSKYTINVAYVPSICPVLTDKRYTAFVTPVNMLLYDDEIDPLPDSVKIGPLTRALPFTSSA